MDADKMIYALFVTAMGMSIVFIVLLLLRYVIALMKLVFAPNAKTNGAATVKVVTTVPDPAPEAKEPLADEGELIAVITAAVVAFMGGRSNFVVKNITRVGDSSPAWAKSGRQEQMLNRF